MSRYDLKGLEDLLRSPLNELRTEMEDVTLHMTDEEWKEIISETHEEKKKKNMGKESLISFGSPNISIASERILADMIGIPPHSKDIKHNDLPFYFVFPPRRGSEEVKTSSFIFTKPLNKEAIGDIDYRTMKSLGEEQRAIVVLEETYIQKKKEEEYGILIAQRRKPHGHVSIVLCGCHGPSTLGLSRVLAQGDITKNLPELNFDATYQPILTAVICAQVEFREGIEDSTNRDIRKLIKYRIIREPRVLIYDDRNQKWK